VQGAANTTATAPQISTASLKLGNGGTGTDKFLKAAYNNSPFQAASFIGSSTSITAGVTARMVSMAIRITCDTAEMQLGGRCYVYQQEDHANLNSISVDLIGNSEETVIYKCKELSRLGATLSCTSENEAEYPYGDQTTASYQTQSIYPYSCGNQLISGGIYGAAVGTLSGINAIASPINVGAAPCVIILQPSASTSNPATFWVEIVQHVEYIGILSMSDHTATHVDPPGFALVQAAKREADALRMSAPSIPYKTLFERSMSMAASAVTVLQNNPQAVRAAASMGMRMFGGSMGNLRLTNG